ncbi:MAG: hypothetical protein U0805_21080 [Pirellulales bacterium]
MTNQQPKLTTDQRRILRAIVGFSAVIAQQTPQTWWGPHDREEWQADCQYGPLWAPSKWFREVDSNAEVVRLTRVLKGLEAAGLVITFRRHGRKCTHVRLTNEGATVAQQLAADAAQPERN